MTRIRHTHGLREGAIQPAQHPGVGARCLAPVGGLVWVQWGQLLRRRSQGPYGYGRHPGLNPGLDPTPSTPSQCQFTQLTLLQVSTAMSTLSWMAVEWFFKKRPSVLGIISGTSLSMYVCMYLSLSLSLYVYLSRIRPPFQTSPL